MEKKTESQLTYRQKWQLAATIFAIYWPIRLYVHINHFSIELVQRVWPLWIMEIIVTILFFGLWLTVTDWIQQRFFSKMNREFLIEFDLPAQLATLVVAGALAALFNMAFHRMWVTMAGVERFHFSQPARITAPYLNAEERNQRRKYDNGLTIMAMLSAFYLAANRRGYKRLEDIRVKAEQLKQEATQAQFMALKNQVNPHFLFNSLSILSSLIEPNPKLSIQFVGQLAKAFRYILEQRETNYIKLHDELTFTNAYTFLLHIRFGEKLKITTDVSSGTATKYSIAPLTLQLLIENVVKHNQMSSEEPLQVIIKTEGDYLLITNLIRLRPQKEVSTGLGLKNITDRYRLLTSRPVWFGDQNGMFMVKIPLL
ncbi:histidine kinase [Spirosoma sp. HMF4905]|uniref:Histidine kinase n=1 Tax=Spirosoma arboris TaxID=2682092 RepID=A0A7K1SCD2_9BACT|nr:histidine kinase [Spirosoma arboris]MVM31435.1 histidine kinase [Spirosoma arboris]